MKLHLKILGTPTPKQSARFRIVQPKGKKPFVSSYQKKSVMEAAKNIALQIKPQLPKGFVPFQNPVAADVIFVFPPLKSWSKKKLEELESGAIIYKDTYPDIDNTAKNLFDGMGKLVFANDSKICKIRIQKIFGFEPRTEVTMFELC